MGEWASGRPAGRLIMEPGGVDVDTGVLPSLGVDFPLTFPKCSRSASARLSVQLGFHFPGRLLREGLMQNGGKYSRSRTDARTKACAQCPSPKQFQPQPCAPNPSTPHSIPTVLY